jgi:hypothetical protein
MLKGWAREWAKEGVKVDWEKFMPPEGFLVLPGRRVVERTIAWIDQNRRTSLGTTRAPAGERRSLDLRGDESPDAQAFGSLMRLFGQSLPDVE